MRKISKIYNGNPLNRLLFSYIIFAVLFVFVHVCFFAVNYIGYSTGKYVEKELTLNDFEIIGGEITDEKTLGNRSDDTQLIYTGNIRNLVVKCTFSENPGEFICFYNSKGNNVFGTHKMEYTKIYDGCYLFEFPLGTKQIRLDTGIFPTTITVFEKIIINKPSAATIFGFKSGDLFTLLILPVVWFMVIETIQPAIKSTKIAKKIKRR